jgi:hypothetical protein
MITKIDFTSEYDKESIIMSDDCIEIFGIKYAYEFFRRLGKEIPLKKKFRIVERKDKMISIEITYNEDKK